MANHKWENTGNRSRGDRYREYVCTRCGIGPVFKDVFEDKQAIATAAKKQGLSTDCNVEIVKKIQEE